MNRSSFALTITCTVVFAFAALFAPFPAAASAIDIGLVPMQDFSCDALAPATPSASTPAAGTASPQIMLPSGTPVLTEADYPAGDDADPAVAEALVALETRYAACLNAGDLPAAASILAQPLRDRLFSPALLAKKAQASPVPSSDPVGAIALRCIRQSGDGAAVAFIDHFDDNAVRTSTMMRVYRELADGWHVVEQAGVKGVSTESCP
jgi:hypothetical protein